MLHTSKWIKTDNAGQEIRIKKGSCAYLKFLVCGAGKRAKFVTVGRESVIAKHLVWPRSYWGVLPCRKPVDLARLIQF